MLTLDVKASNAFITSQSFGTSQGWKGDCGGLEMEPYVNKWSPLDGAHE